MKMSAEVAFDIFEGIAFVNASISGPRTHASHGAPQSRGDRSEGLEILASRLPILTS